MQSVDWSTLPLQNAEFLTYFSDRPLAKQMELAVSLITKSRDVAEKMCAFLLKHHESTVQDAFQNVIGQYGEISKTIKMDNATHLALSEACMAKQINFEDLIEKIVDAWLMENGFLQPLESLGAKAEHSNSVRISKAGIKSAGYKLLKSLGDVEIYQKTVKGHTGFFKATFSKASVAYVSITAGNYDIDESEEMLMREIERLQEIKSKRLTQISS